MLNVPENKAILKINKAMRGYSQGSEVEIKTDEHGTPLDKYWRRRLEDSKTDESCEIKTLKKKGAK